tara:strand:- start:38082 stop:40466 length:2385 start_codon:yes stop_codon:yes gene_type:complete
MKKLILDSKKFNLMMERMENKYTLEETTIKKRNLILEGFPKGVVGDILSAIGKNADEIESALKKVNIKIGSNEGQNFLRGFNFFEDPLSNISEWRNVSMGTFAGTLKKLSKGLQYDDILKKLNSVSDVAAEIEKGGNPVKNLIQTIDNAGLGLEEVERIVEDTLEIYPDMFKNSDIQPVNGSKIFKEGDSVSNFVRRSIIRENGSFVDGVPDRTKNRIMAEVLRERKGTPNIETKDGPKDGEEVLVGPDGKPIIVDGPGKGKKPPKGWKKFLWNATGIPLWWKAVSKGDFVSLKSADGWKGKVGGGLYNVLQFKWKLAKGLLIPFPPLLYGWLGNCIYKNYIADIDDIEIMKDGKTAKYEPTLLQCLGDWEVDTNGNTVNEIGFNFWQTFGVVNLIQYGAVPFVEDWASDKLLNYLSVAENKVNSALNNIFKGKTLPELLNIKCDTETIKTLEEYYLGELKKTDFGYWSMILDWVPGVESLTELQSKLGESETEKVLELFGTFENIKKWQESTYKELEKYLPDSEKKESYNVKDIMKAKCENFRINAIIIAIKNMNGKISEFPTKNSGPGKNTNGSLCENLRFWEELSTPIGGSQWDSETCVDNTNEIRHINTLINETEGYSTYQSLTNKTLLDPEIWEQSCINLKKVHDGTPSVAEWICEQDSNKEFGDNTVEIELEVEEIPMEVKVYNYKWQKFIESNQVITTSQGMIDALNNQAASKGKYLISPNEEGSGLTEDADGNREYDLCNTNVQKVWINDYWCKPKNLTSIGRESGKTTTDCVNDFKDYLKEENIC